MKKPPEPQAEHYVYLYRDHNNRPRYVGYGRQPARAAFHATGSHNESLTEFLQEGRYSLEIAGPFGSKETAMAVETALISALRPQDNIHKGKALCRFRPYGVSDSYAHRLTQEPLDEAALIAATRRGTSNGQAAPILFVYISEQDFEDGREGFKPAKPLSDQKILQRMEKWWHIGVLVEQWEINPAQSPAYLVAVTGKPQSRIIAAAVKIDKAAWADAQTSGYLYCVPTKLTPELDACRLRGRRISSQANIKFGALTTQFFLLLNPDGSRAGGGSGGRRLPSTSVHRQ